MVFSVDYAHYGAPNEKPGCGHPGRRGTLGWCLACLAEMKVSMEQMQVEGRALLRERLNQERLTARRRDDSGES